MTALPARRRCMVLTIAGDQRWLRAGGLLNEIALAALMVGTVAEVLQGRKARGSA